MQVLEIVTYLDRTYDLTPTTLGRAELHAFNSSQIVPPATASLRKLFSS